MASVWTVISNVAQPKPTAAEMLEEMQALLRSVASSSSLNRLWAVRYTECRAELLNSDLRPVLPGFLVQCVSINKFHDFIHLYDPSPEARVAFLDAAFETSGSQLQAKSVYDVFRDPDF